MPAKILIVDDEIEICRSLRRLLRRFDFEVAFTTSPGEALELLERQAFEAVISDYRMPEMTGTELLGEISRKTPRTLRLMLSACAEIDTLAQTYDEAQILRFIRKPWNDDELVSYLCALLAEKGATPVGSAQLDVHTLEGASHRVW
jgi:DNA-binding NtrC family response regulator